jgi:elongation factor Tu
MKNSLMRDRRNVGKGGSVILYGDFLSLGEPSFRIAAGQFSARGDLEPKGDSASALHVISYRKVIALPPSIVVITGHPFIEFTSSSSVCGHLYNMSFARTLLSTSRALRNPHSAPIQCALNARGRTQFAAAAAVAVRGYATAFERSKPHVNIGTIGHVDHGKVDITGSLCIDYRD